jgi:hypothetical protein
LITFELVLAYHSGDAFQQAPRNELFVFSAGRGTEPTNYEETNIRGGRNIGERDARTGADGSDQVAVVCVFTGSRTGRTFGSP